MAQRFRELDGLRGVAAFAVLIGHYTLSHNTVYLGDERSPWEFVWGEYGVQLFFFISGFVILMTAQRAKRASDFVISRVSRLYPAYWAAVVVSSALVMIFKVPHHDMPLWQRFANLMMVQRWFQIPNVDLVYWTLAIEMQFYVLLFIMLVWTKCNITPRHVLFVGLLWVGVGLVVVLLVGAQTRGLAPTNVATPIKILLNVTLAEQAPLFVGGMFAYLGRNDLVFRRLSWVMGGLAVLFAGLVKTPSAALAVAIVAVVFFVVVQRERTGVLLWRPIQFYGKISYTLYIQHAVTGLVLMHLLIPVTGRIAAMIITAVVVTLWCWVMYEIFEVRASRAFKGYLVRVRDSADSRTNKP